MIESQPHPSAPAAPGRPDEFCELMTIHPGIVCVSVPSPGTLDITYVPEKISQEEVREFASRADDAVKSHMARCTMPLHGRACETCGDRLKSRLETVPGVRHAKASFLHGSISVVFDRQEISTTQLVKQAKKLGAPLVTREEFMPVWKRVIRALDSVRWQKVLVSVAGVALVAGFALSRTGSAPPLTLNLLWAVAYVTAGYSGVRSTIRALRMLALDIDVLMVVAAIGAALINAPAEGALLLFLFSLSSLLQDLAVGKARRAIAALLDLRPQVALVKEGEQLTETPVDAVPVGAHIVLRPGERVPLDGEIVTGFGSINQAPVTGESIPVEKQPGDQVFTGTLNEEGSLEVKVTRPSSDSTLARMISLVEAAQSEKATTQQFLDTAEQYYAGGVIAVTAGLAVLPPLLSQITFGDAFYRAVTVMVVASPCALILSTPAAILSAIAGLGRRGILVKGGKHLEDGATIKAVAFDKTGTLTVGRPSVTDVIPLSSFSSTEPLRELLSLAAQAEGLSDHPLAKAIIDRATEDGLPLPPLQDYQNITGRGGEAVLSDGTRVIFGSVKLMQDRGCRGIEELKKIAEDLELAGKTIVCVAKHNSGSCEIAGVLALQDVLRKDAAHAVQCLRQMGIKRIVMLSGDSPGVAKAVAAQAGIDEVYGGLMPEDKVRAIKEISMLTPAMMVGDGINDAPALAAANLGLAMGAAGTDVAMETADVVLMSHDLAQVPIFLQVSRKARRVIAQNLGFAVAVVMLLLIATLGFHLTLSLGVLGHEGSTVLVCLNGLRLLRPPKMVM